MSLGPQYSRDDDFKASARLHQSRFRLEELGLQECRNYGNRLTSADARAGKNFCDWLGTTRRGVHHHSEAGDLVLVQVPMELANEPDVRDLHGRYTRESALALRDGLRENVLAAAPAARARRSRPSWRG